MSDAPPPPDGSVSKPRRIVPIPKKQPQTGFATAP